MKRRLATAVVAAGFIALSPAAALAYGAPSPSVSVSAGVITAGQSVDFSGDGFAPGSSVVVAIAEGDDSPVLVGEVLTDDAGAFSVEVTLPESGDYTLVASGFDADGNERTVTASVRVTGEAGSDDGSDEESGSGSGSGTGTGSGSGSGSDTHGATMRSDSGSGVSRSAVRTARTASTGTSSEELAHTGVDGLGLQVGAAVALVVVGGAAVGTAAVRRKRASA